jgi:hypothetical protein
MLNYLESQESLDLRLEACDAASATAMSDLIGSIDDAAPLSGCMLMSTVVSDRLFSRHTEESFRAASTPKLGSLRALEQALPISSLDFLVAFSSAASFGNIGQTAYSRYATDSSPLL